jgi:hypothetical protein
MRRFLESRTIPSRSQDGSVLHLSNTIHSEDLALEESDKVQSELAAAERGGSDHEWWQALRRTVGRVLDLLESSARFDAELRADLSRLFGDSQAPASRQAGPQSATELPNPATIPPAGDATAAPANVMEETSASGSATPAQPGDVTRAETSPVNTPFVPRPSTLTGPRLVEPPAAPAFAYPQRWTLGPFDPARVAMSCRLKAEACRWQSRRREMLDAGEDVSGGDHELVARARAADVWLWMVSPNKWRERTDAAFATVAGCYDALADAAELMGLADRLQQQQEISIRLLAEAQSSVRAAVEDYGSTRRDQDQELTFIWLREQTDVRRIYVDYMQLDNPAPPDNHEQLRRRIAQVCQELEGLRKRGQTVESTIKKIAYHAKKLAQLPDDQTPDITTNGDVLKIAEAAGYLLQQGVPPSDLRLREPLAPIFQKFAAMDTEGQLQQSAPDLCRVLESIGDWVDQAEASRELLEGSAERGEPDERDERDQREDSLVISARQRVAGRDALLIGGTPSELHRGRLEHGLGLHSLEWIRLEHHESFDAAATAIRRPNVGLVMLMTRWRSHRDGPAARELCRKLGIPLVELPAGYNLRQVAHRIVEQTSE